MRRKTILMTAAILAVLAVSLGLFIWKTTTQEAEIETPPAPTHQPLPTSLTTGPTPTDNGIEIPYRDADQAPERPTETPTHPTQEINQPTPNPELDRQNPEAVAREIITLYTSRTSDTDTTYQEQIKDHLTPELTEEIFNAPLTAFTDAYPIAVQEVNFGDNISEWGIDTPVRYSHYATAKIATATHGNYIVDYRIAAMHNGEHWVITDLAIDSWSAHHE